MVLDNLPSVISPWAIRIFMVPLEESWKLQILRSQSGEAFRGQLEEMWEFKSPSEEAAFRD
jgi:hypothetical protein